MPAIQLARLRRQSAELAELFSQPEAFLAHLQTLLDFYADRTRRPGQTGKPAPLIKAYQAPRQILRQISIDLDPMIQAQPEAALLLADLLWEQNWLETRLLAIDILGKIQLQDYSPIVARARTWSAVCEDVVLLDSLLAHGLSRLRDRAEADYLKLVAEWAGSSAIQIQRTALRSMRVLAGAPQFENLPFILRLLSPYVRVPQVRLEAETVQVIQALARRSPSETAFFLQQALAASRADHTHRLVRKSLPDFPEQIQLELKNYLRQRRADIE